MTVLPSELRTPLVDLLLAVADDKFILGHRNADWTGLAPLLEEDIAFSALAQDDLAHASALYEFVANLTDGDPNRLAYGRKPEEYRCCHLVELPDEFDWAVALVRQFLCSHFELLRLGRLANSSYEPLRALAARVLAEQRLSLGHADQWIVRLGKGTEESGTRIQGALDKVAPLATTLFEPTAGVEQLEAAGVYPRGEREMFAAWREAVDAVTREAGLRLAREPLPADYVGGRRGQRSVHFAALHDELTEVFRVEPEAAW